MESTEGSFERTNARSLTTKTGVGISMDRDHLARRVAALNAHVSTSELLREVLSVQSQSVSISLEARTSEAEAAALAQENSVLKQYMDNLMTHAHLDRATAHAQ